MSVTDETKSVEVDVTKLTALSPEVISKQATINIGKKNKSKKKKKRLTTINVYIQTLSISCCIFIYFSSH